MIKSHTFTAKFIHWTFSGLYAYGIFKQVGDLSELEDTDLLNSLESIENKVYDEIESR